MASNKAVQYVDFGITSARQFWDENVVPVSERFKAQPNRANAIDASVSAWHVHEWIWHEHHPGTDTRQNIDYRNFQADLFNACPQIAWIRDVADAGKHRGLGRPAKVKRVASDMVLIGGPITSAPIGTTPISGSISIPTPLTVTFTDGSKLTFRTVLSCVLDYWQASARGRDRPCPAGRGWQNGAVLPRTGRGLVHPPLPPRRRVVAEHPARRGGSAA